MEFSADFFNREEKSGFEIPEMMKRAWAAAMEVLQVVVDICKKNGIMYFADWGTLLGAVRHQGFIPWDDDIDICLKREDYQRLLHLLPQELPEGFVLAGMYSPSERLRNAAYCQHMRVIADETIWNFNNYMKYFHGFPYQRIGIDIFPLDYLCRDIETLALQKEIVRFVTVTLQEWEKFSCSGELEIRLRQIEDACNVTVPQDDTAQNYLWKLVDSVSSLYTCEEADEVAEIIFCLEDQNYHMKKEWYDSVVMLPFEHTEIAVPCCYQEALTAMYGKDYMTPSRKGMEHGYPFYGHMEEELVKQIRAVGFAGTVEEFCRKVSSGELRV